MTLHEPRWLLAASSPSARWWRCSGCGRLTISAKPPASCDKCRQIHAVLIRSTSRVLAQTRGGRSAASAPVSLCEYHALRGYWWLSFVDPTKPEKGGRFSGVCIVLGNGMQDAIKRAWAAGCNPGGEVQGQFVGTEASIVPPEYLNRLYRTKAEAYNAERILAAINGVPYPKDPP